MRTALVLAALTLGAFFLPANAAASVAVLAAAIVGVVYVAVAR